MLRADTNEDILHTAQTHQKQRQCILIDNTHLKLTSVNLVWSFIQVQNYHVMKQNPSAGHVQSQIRENVNCPAAVAIDFQESS